MSVEENLSDSTAFFSSACELEAGLLHFTNKLLWSLNCRIPVLSRTFSGLLETFCDIVVSTHPS